MILRLTVAAILVVLLNAPRLGADVFLLATGGRVEGELLNPDEAPRETYLLQTVEGGKLKLASRQVERVVTKSAAEKRYDAFVESLPDTVESHLDTASRCEKAELAELREYHLEQVLRLDPNHEDARRALGYSPVGGVWVKADELMREKGYVRYGRAWRLPREIELSKAEAETEQQVVEWRKKIRRWREWAVKADKRALEGRAEIVGIRDPLAGPVLIEALTRDKDPPAIRLLYVEALSEIGGPDALVTFVRLVLDDRDPEVREACLDRLAKSGSKIAVRQFIKALKHDQNLVVRRSAAALERMNDPEATLPLIEALQTEHKKVIGSGGLAPSFSGDGGAAFSAGGGQKVVKFWMDNEPALRALAAIHVGVNFGFDQPRWRAWYIEMTRPKVMGNLRRGP